MKATIADLGSAYQYLKDSFTELAKASFEENESLVRRLSAVSWEDNMKATEDVSLWRIEKEVALHEAQCAERYLFEVIEKLIAQGDAQ